jgi:uncharacterized lipoprotein YehR (DUF1307 family)
MIRIMVALVAVLAMVGCGDEDHHHHHDSTATAENCKIVNDAAGAQYKLCCSVTCSYHYDHDEYMQQCTQQQTCTPPTNSACPPSIIEENGYPTCPD